MWPLTTLPPLPPVEGDLHYYPAVALGEISAPTYFNLLF